MRYTNTRLLLLLLLHKNDVKNMWNIIKEKILETVHKYVPSNLPFSSWKKLPGNNSISASIRNIIRQKCKLWKRYIQSKDPEVLSSYKKFLISSEIKLDRQTDLIKMK